jgi:light-regulated signal transduction histidine kinase (bacteriophytochrome)
MSAGDLERQLAAAQATIHALQEELAETNRGLLALTIELDKRVAERTAQLESANRELEAFSYSVSHDLRTPLHAIDNFAKLLLEEESEGLSPSGRQYVELIDGNARQMLALVNALLALSRSGREPLHKQRVAMVDLVRQALGDLQSQQQGRQVTIVLGDLPEAEADPILLKQVWVNLLSNALKFTRRREVARIEIGSRPKASKPVFFVRDNGVGFDATQAEKLFGAFQRLHSEEEYEGTGIGLAIVQRIIHRHGGHVSAEAELDHGASFYFTLG